MRHFLSITPIVKSKSDDFYRSELMRFLLEEFWPSQQQDIIRYQFLPYLAYVFMSVTFMYYGLRRANDNEDESSGQGQYETSSQDSISIDEDTSHAVNGAIVVFAFANLCLWL